MKLLRSTKSKISRDKNSENLPHLQITEVVLVHCNITNNDYQQYSRVFYIYVSNRLFGQLLDISRKKKKIIKKPFRKERSVSASFFKITIFSISFSNAKCI